MSMTIWTEDWFEPGPNSPAIPLSRWSPSGVTPTYDSSGDPFAVGGIQYAGWVAKFNSDAENPSQAFRLPQNGGGTGSTLDECRWYAQFLLHPPRSGQTRFEVGPYSGTRAWFEYYSGSWKAGVYSTVDLGTGVGPWVVEVAYVADALPALNTSADVTWRVWLRINGVLVEDGTTLYTSSEHNGAAYGLRTPLFNARSGTSDGFCVSSIYGRYGVTATDAQALFHRTESWTGIHPGETLLYTLNGMEAARIGGNGVDQVPIADTIGFSIPSNLQAHRGLRLRGIFTGCNVQSYTLGAYLFSYLKIKTSAVDGTDVTPNSSAGTLAAPDLPDKVRYTGTFDISITAETFAPNPSLCVPDISGALTVTVEGGSTYTLPYTYYGAGYPVCTWTDFLAAWVQLTAGSTGSDSHIFQMEEVHVSEWLTMDPPDSPAIYPPSGAYKGVQLAVLTAQTGTIRYTTDGSDPTTSSEIFTHGFRITDGMTIKAVVDLDGLLSPVSEASYSIVGNKLVSIPSYTAHVLPYLLEQYKGDNP